jgi:hypothetical protein
MCTLRMTNPDCHPECNEGSRLGSFVTLNEVKSLALNDDIAVTLKSNARSFGRKLPQDDNLLLSF